MLALPLVGVFFELVTRVGGTTRGAPNRIALGKIARSAESEVDRDWCQSAGPPLISDHNATSSLYKLLMPQMEGVKLGKK